MIDLNWSCWSELIWIDLIDLIDHVDLDLLFDPNWLFELYHFYGLDDLFEKFLKLIFTPREIDFLDLILPDITEFLETLFHPSWK